MRNSGLDEAQARIKIAGININNFRYADDITFMAESEEELKNLLIKVKAENEKVALKLNIPRSLLKLMSIESVMPSNHLILCHPLFLLTSIFPSIRVFSNESVLHIRWPKYWSRA